MTIRSGMFNSVRDSSGNNGDRKYLAEFFAAYFASFVGNGVFPNPSTGLQVMTGGSMSTIVKSGKGWINGYFLINDADEYLYHDISDGALKRIDRVVMRLDFNMRSIEIKIKKGAYSSNPTAPALERSVFAHELALADVLIDRGVSEITQTQIVDTRLNTDLCGIVQGMITQVDTTTIFNQYQDWYNTFTTEQTSTFEQWSEEQKETFEQFASDQRDTFDNFAASERADFEQFAQAREDEFDAFFQLIKDQLSEDQAGNLQVQIYDHENAQLPHKYLSEGVYYKYGLARNPTLNCVSFIYEEV